MQWLVSSTYSKSLGKESKILTYQERPLRAFAIPIDIDTLRIDNKVIDQSPVVQQACGAGDELSRETVAM